MIEQILDLPAGVVGFQVHGQVSANDYEGIIVPDVEAAFALNRKLNLMYVTAPDFVGFDSGAMWDDAKLGARHFSGWNRVALVTDVPWLQLAANTMGFMMPGKFRLFPTVKLAEAKQWISEAIDA